MSSFRSAQDQPYIVYRSRDDQLGSRSPRRGWERVK
jgi:nitrate reductase gamma subunit